MEQPETRRTALPSLVCPQHRNHGLAVERQYFNRAKANRAPIVTDGASSAEKSIVSEVLLAPLGAKKSKPHQTAGKTCAAPDLDDDRRQQVRTMARRFGFPDTCSRPNTESVAQSSH